MVKIVKILTDEMQQKKKKSKKNCNRNTLYTVVSLILNFINMLLDCHLILTAR